LYLSYLRMIAGASSTSTSPTIQPRSGRHSKSSKPSPSTARRSASYEIAIRFTDMSSASNSNG
jgi:hypothetical protein